MDTQTWHHSQEVNIAVNSPLLVKVLSLFLPLPVSLLLSPSLLLSSLPSLPSLPLPSPIHTFYIGVDGLVQDQPEHTPLRNHQSEPPRKPPVADRTPSRKEQHAAVTRHRRNHVTTRHQQQPDACQDRFSIFLESAVQQQLQHT